MGGCLEEKILVSYVFLLSFYTTSIIIKMVNGARGATDLMSVG